MRQAKTSALRASRAHVIDCYWRVTHRRYEAVATLAAAKSSLIGDCRAAKARRFGNAVERTRMRLRLVHAAPSAGLRGLPDRAGLQRRERPKCRRSDPDMLSMARYRQAAMSAAARCQYWRTKDCACPSGPHSPLASGRRRRSKSSLERHHSTLPSGRAGVADSLHGGPSSSAPREPALKATALAGRICDL